MIEIVQLSGLLLSLSLAITALKRDFVIATIMMILLFVVLYFVN